MSLVEVVERHQTELSVELARLQDGSVEERDDLVVAIVGLPANFTNTIHRARLTPENVEGRVARVAALLVERSLSAIWWVSPLDTPSTLADVLQRNGFRHEEDMPWMAASLGALSRAPLPEGVETHRVDGPERFARFLDAMMRGFGEDPATREAMVRLHDVVGFGDEAPWQRFVATEDGRPVGSSGLMLGGAVAGIYNVATPPEERGRGIGAALTTVAMGWARERGYETAVLGSSLRAVPLYERLGFRHVCRMGVYLYEP